MRVHAPCPPPSADSAGAVKAEKGDSSLTAAEPPPQSISPMQTKCCQQTASAAMLAWPVRLGAEPESCGQRQPNSCTPAAVRTAVIEPHSGMGSAPSASGGVMHLPPLPELFIYAEGDKRWRQGMGAGSVCWNMSSKMTFPQNK